MAYKLLDLYCGGGGASFGYELAGFEVTGVDIVKQTNYVGDFVCDDAITFLLDCYAQYDCVHASPPCQAYSKLTASLRHRGKQYSDLVQVTRDALISTNLPYIIENVVGAPLIGPILLCGTMFNIPTYRHRLFESNIPLYTLEHKPHVVKCNYPGRRPKDGEFIEYAGHFPGADIVKRFTGLTWLTTNQLAQSIPPQYTRFLGLQMKDYLDKLC